MPAYQDKHLHVLCYEHHVEMRMTAVSAKMESFETQTSAYGCQEVDCPVCYTVSKGYFLQQQQGGLDIMPRVICPRDGRPMYLAETNPQKRGFRLWRCPQCDASRTNEENLLNAIP